MQDYSKLKPSQSINIRLRLMTTMLEPLGSVCPGIGIDRIVIPFYNYITIGIEREWYICSWEVCKELV